MHSWLRFHALRWGLLCCVAVLALTGCSQSQSLTPAPSPVASATPAAPALKPANRVVALTSLSADIVQRLDQTKLVGIAGSRLLAKNPKLTALPRVSEGRTPPNLEKIVELKPDLVIGSVGFHDQTIAKLKSLGIQTLLWEVDSWRSLTTLTQTLAKAVQADPAPLLKQYERCLDAKPTQQASTLILASRQPLMSPNAQSWAGDLLTQLGVNNVAAELQGKSPMRGYITLSPEKVLEANPEVIILVDTPDGGIEQVKAEPFWRQLQAAKAQRVYTLDYYGLVNPGSVETIQKACAEVKKIDLLGHSIQNR